MFHGRITQTLLNVDEGRSLDVDWRVEGVGCL